MHIRLGVVIASVLVAGCGPDLDGELKAPGNFTDLKVFEAEGSPWAAALSGSELALLSFADGRQCRVGSVSAFLPAEGAVAIWSEDDGCGFVDTSCRALIDPLACGGAPEELTARVLGGPWSEHLFLRTADGALRLVQPWSNEVIELGSAVRAWHWAAGASFWMLDGGSLVLRDLDGQPDRQLGIEVSDVTFLAQGAAIYADRDGVWWVRTPSEAPELLAAGACEPQATRGGGGIAYLLPCAERNLVVHDLELGTSTAIASNVGDFRADTSPIFFEQGATLFAHVGREVVEVAAGGVLTSLRRAVHEGRVSHLLLTDGARLMRFDGSTTQPLFDDVHAFRVRHEHIAVVDGGGRLSLQSEGGGTIESLASGVPADRFGFASQLEALGWIADFDGESGRLELDSLTTEHQGAIDVGVSEFVEVRSDTLPGVAYLVPAGPRAGIWLATP